MEILIKADMVTDAMVSTDCEIEDLNLMDRDYREFGDRIIYFIDTTEMGPGTAIPQCLLYKNVFPEYRVGGLRNSARIKENTSLAEVFRYVKLLLGAEPGGQTGYADIVSKLVSGVAMKDVLSAAFSYTGNLFVAIDLSGKILEYSTPFCVEYPLWMQSIQQGYCDEVLMDYIQSRRRRIPASEKTGLIDLYCRKTKMYILVARIRHNNITLGYFFALSSRPSFDSCTRKLLPLFAQKVKDNILWLKNMNEVNDYRAIMQTSILLDAAGSYLALTARFDANGFRGIGIKLCGDAFDVQDDLGNVFLHALDRGELMDYPVDFNAGDCHARQAGKQHTPQAVAQGGTETALQRLHDEFAVTAVCGKAGGIDLGSLNLHHSKTLLSSGRRRHAACQNVRIR